MKEDQAKNAELARLRAALAEAERERDEARKRRDFAVAGEENIRYLKRLWEQECGYYRARWWGAEQAAERQRRTIRALVVAARAMWWALRHMGGHQPFFIGLVRSEAALFNRMGVTSELEILERQRAAERGQAGKE